MPLVISACGRIGVALNMRGEPRRIRLIQVAMVAGEAGEVRPNCFGFGVFHCFRDPVREGVEGKWCGA
jgi:hypothetical protein